MKRATWSIVVPIGVMLALSVTFFQSGDAQDQTPGRLSALETTVAGQSTAIASLTKRVKALESKSAPKVTATTSDALGANSFKGSGEDVKKVHLAAGLYVVKAHSDGGFFFITVLDSTGNIVDSSVTISDPQHEGAAPLTISAAGDYIFEIKGTSGWTVDISVS